VANTNSSAAFWAHLGTNGSNSPLVLAPAITSTKKLAGPCFSDQLKKCSGFCAGQESLFQHNVRLVGALAQYKFQD
jgi:hypothetical protein